MKRWLTALRVCVIAALVASSASGVEDYLADHSFCAPGGGCDAVRESALGQSIGKLLPALGLVAYTTILFASLAPAVWLRKLALALAMAGGLGGAALLAVQAIAVGQFCWLCVGVDSSAVAAAIFAGLAWRAGALDEGWSESRWSWVWQIAALWAIAAPPIWTLSRPAEIPELVESAWLDDHLNVVEWSDFNCPHCQKMHPVLTELIAGSARPVNLVRVNVALRSRHDARAYRCAVDQGQGEAMADALFGAESRSEQACAALAAELGLDLDRFRSCVADPATDAAIEADKARVRGAGLDGLPTVWIGARKFVGFDETRSPARYAAAFEDADARPRHRLGGWLGLVLLSALLCWVGMRREA